MRVCGGPASGNTLWQFDEQPSPNDVCTADALLQLFENEAGGSQ